MSNDDKLLTKLMVTPIIVHAVSVLRTAIPRRLVQAGVKAMVVSLDEYGCHSQPYFEYHDWVRQAPTDTLRLTDAQRAAAGLLVGAAAFYEARWRETFGIGQIDEDRASIPPAYLALRDRFNRNVRHELNVRIGGSVWDGDRYLHGSVTVYL